MVRFELWRAALYLQVAILYYSLSTMIQAEGKTDTLAYVITW